jgi:hypothetical protein
MGPLTGVEDLTGVMGEDTADLRMVRTMATVGGRRGEEAARARRKGRDGGVEVLRARSGYWCRLVCRDAWNWECGG